ncbi:MAG: bifunctional adenosylcobinamide kinase/adenosylcobinamide-phosphate guanylyltransferase [Alicyclobacillus herbarius]|uniref:bifunctional adenosylcobinamide kinase/adenosylcobinamide-phosphate guanylyltransferase n=1 Tax=Alicyclobacillus herbarius TaxID=122960 RepID=UPI0023527CA4|nr:bifunctional adenosylcobinamide kinase/adenosylcobinamide-phosphate guanylyltransferase [Alicyclobacillus herbarius]MCL6631918.1 bifunctional adenosylcobinamide kinase/adenosylcobinamide-phosphate guanylyltransferase [Alicyclobacillus herbarius]
MKSVFVLGGARSGKSGYAETRARQLAATHELSVTYVATAEVTDDEMADRIRRHREARPSAWRTLEEPMDIAPVLARATAHDLILVDCLSLLLNNWLYVGCSEDTYLQRVTALTDALKRGEGRAILVSNEVGAGIVPGDHLSRLYRDWLGWLNQNVAAVADEVVWMVAGIPVPVKEATDAPR